MPLPVLSFSCRVRNFVVFGASSSSDLHCTLLLILVPLCEQRTCQLLQSYLDLTFLSAKGISPEAPRRKRCELLYPTLSSSMPICKYWDHRLKLWMPLKRSGKCFVSNCPVRQTQICCCSLVFHFWNVDEFCGITKSVASIKSLPWFGFLQKFVVFEENFFVWNALCFQ